MTTATRDPLNFPTKLCAACTFGIHNSLPNAHIKCTGYFYDALDDQDYICPCVCPPPTEPSATP